MERNACHRYKCIRKLTRLRNGQSEGAKNGPVHMGAFLALNEMKTLAGEA